jgi:CRISPR system Cascade subunit CasA
MGRFSYNLIDQDWIPVLDTGGRLRYVGIRELLIGAPRYRLLAANLPQTNAALYRLLLAILHRVFPMDTVGQWGELWKRGTFDAAALEAYLQQWHERFDLFSPQHPFYQRQNPAVELKPANALLFMTGGGNPETLFDHNIDDRPLALPPAEAALALLTAQSFALAGLCHPQLKLVYTDAPCSRAAVILLQGKDLFESLMLNLVGYNRAVPIPWRSADDPPAWEMDDPYLPERSMPNGYLDYLTWHNRRILLFPEQVGEQVLVTQISTAPGLVLSSEQRNPMHHYRIDEGAKEGQSPYRVLRFTEGKALWRDSAALMVNAREKAERANALVWAEQLKMRRVLPRRKLTLAAYGMATEPGKAKVNFYRADQFEFSDDLLDRPELANTLERALARADQARSQLWGAVSRLANLLLAPGGDDKDGHKADPNAVKQLIAHWNAEGYYWQALELPFYSFLDGLPQQGEQAYAAWIEAVRRAARNAFDVCAELAGTSMRALKASARAELQLQAGLNKELEPVQKEDKTNA